VSETKVAMLRHWRAADGREGDRLYMWCPACDDLHAVEVTAEPVRWEWDGNADAPTISPSIKVEYGPHSFKPSVCHSFVKAGRWEFCDDSRHPLHGQTAAMVALPDWIVREQGQEGVKSDEAGD
jgi:uncharacterized protein DUF6527